MNESNDLPRRRSEAWDVMDLHLGLLAGHEDQSRSWKNCQVIHLDAALDRGVRFAALAVPDLDRLAVHADDLKSIYNTEIFVFFQFIKIDRKMRT